MDGYDLVETIYTQYAHLKSSCIVMVSGEENGSYKKIFKEFGVHQFIKKPIAPASFIHHIKPLIAKAERNATKLD